MKCIQRKEAEAGKQSGLYQEARVLSVAMNKHPYLGASWCSVVFFMNMFDKPGWHIGLPILAAHYNHLELLMIILNNPKP